MLILRDFYLHLNKWNNLPLSIKNGGVIMRTVIKPFKMKKLNKKLTALLKQSLENAPVAPIEQLKQEAAEFEEMMLKKRNSIG